MATMRQQTTAYSAVTAACGLLAVATTFAPGAVLPIAIGAAGQPLTTHLLAVVGSHFWVIAAASNCLQTAAKHDQLASRTYQRLNMAIFIQAMLLAVVQLMHIGLLGSAASIGSAAILLVTALITLRVHMLTHDGKVALLDTLNGFAAGLQRCVHPANASSAYYGFIALSCIVVGVPMFFSDGMPLLCINGPVSASDVYLNRTDAILHTIIGYVCFVLKDASDNGQLGATTSRKLNLGLVMFWLVELWYIYQIGTFRGVDALRQPTINASSAVGAVVCAWQAFAPKNEVE